MTLKSYLRMLLAAVTLMFVTTGCNDDEEKVGPPPSYTFGIAVSDVTETEATVTVTPSNDQATYYYGAVKKADFDAFESDAAYAQNILATLKAAADRKVLSLEEYLQTALSKGSSPKKITDLTAGTDYYAVAIGILTDGRLTSDLVKEAFKTIAAPEPAPELTITMTPGVQGENTDTAMSVDFKVSGSEAVSAKYLLGATSIIETMHGQGKTDEAILAEYGVDFTAKELEELNSVEGTQGWYFDDLDPETSYTVIAKVTNASGISTLKTAEKSTAASQGGGEGPNLTITAIPGKDGAETQTYITAMFKVTGTPAAVSGSYILAEKALVDQIASEKSLTYEQITEATGNEFTADNLTKLNANGVGWYFKELTPGTEHIVMAKVTDAAGNSTFKYVLASTDPDGEASDAYKAWLGTWTVTSTSSQVNSSPVSFDVVFSQKIANLSYAISGWGIDALRDDAELMPTVTFDSATGGITIQNDQHLANNGGQSPGKINFASNVAYQGTYAWVSGTGFNGLSGIINADKQTATVTCGVANITGVGELPVNGMEVILWGSDGKTYVFGPAAGYTKGDYPIGPYTMTKKSSATSAKNAVRSSVIPEVNLSSVLSVKTVVSAPAKQISVKAQASELNTLSFVKPAAVYEATISNVANIEKPLGLKKHFIKK